MGGVRSYRFWSTSQLIPPSDQQLHHSNGVVPKTTSYKQWNCQVIRPANCCHLIPSNRFLNGFPDPNQFAAAKLTHYSTMPHRPSDSSRPRQRLLLSVDVHQNPVPATKYPCSVCASNVTSCGVSYMCNRFSWVHSKLLTCGCSVASNWQPGRPRSDLHLNNLHHLDCC